MSNDISKLQVLHCGTFRSHYWLKMFFAKNMGKLSTLQNIISWEHNLLSCAQQSLLSSAHDIISCHLHNRKYLCAQDNVSCTREYVLCTQENNYFLPVFLLKKKYFCVSNLPLYMLNWLITSNIKTSIFCISCWINFWKILDK